MAANQRRKRAIMKENDPFGIIFVAVTAARKTRRKPLKSLKTGSGLAQVSGK